MAGVAADRAGLLGAATTQAVVAAEVWRPAGVDSFAPAGPRSKAAANLAALETLSTVTAAGRPATHAEQAVLARWSSWGSLPKVFDDDDVEWAPTRARLRELLSEREWSAARRTTLNGHYTDPAVITAMWDFLRAVGFGGGRVLEPGCGSGNFIGLTPPDVEVSWVGVELDPTTAAICALLYPQADIRTEGFETTTLADGCVDAVVGNVPFGQVALYDERHNAAGESIHNHFIIKALHLTRPGGMVAVLTSRYTLDARNPQARATMSDLAGLVTAVRLPGSTHRHVAGTDVVIDLVVLRRRHPDATAADAGPWRRTAALDIGDGSVAVNEWFVDHPELILGEPALGGAYRADDLRVTGVLDSARLATVLAAEAAAAVARGHHHSPIAPASSAARAAAVDVAGVDVSACKPGSIVALPSDGFGRVLDGTVEPFDCPFSARRELGELCGLRDVLTELLEVQATTVGDGRLGVLQADLSRRYDGYTARFGPLNRYTWGRTGRYNDDGVETMRRLRPKMGGFRDDPDAPSVFALEEFDPATHDAVKAAVFTRRVLTPRPVRHGADNAADAVLVCLDQRGRVELDHVADLLGVDETTARSELGELVFDDPATPGRLQPAAAYLSGDVRTKRDAAATAAEADDRYRVNVDALDAVMPVDLGPAEIDVRPGQSWIPLDVIAEFLHDILDVERPNVVHDPLTATWELDVPRWQRTTVTMTSQWGTDRKDAVTLLQAACNNSPVVVYDEIDDRRVQNEQATLDAREKQEQLLARFSTWTWDDPARTARLVDIYNRRFNNHVARSYDGAHLSLPGLAASFQPRPHQRAAVARILAEPTVLLAHEVGAGKTATMVIAAMELRRLGMANKPMVVVPNHMLEQFCTEWRSLYPTARVLFPAEGEQNPAGRKRFVARAAVGEWDGVVVTESTFERIPLAPATEAAFIDEHVEQLRAASKHFAAEVGRRSRTVKDIEMRVLKLVERSKELLHRAGKDDGATFEQLGCDYLMIDEAHHAKNLAISTRLPALGKQGSGYASQLDIRLQWLRRRYGPKVLTMSTATPIANSLSEMWVVQHYATPDVLAAAGVGHFDAWASNFAAQVTRLELAPEGTHYRVATRLARFRNVPDLVRMFSIFADVRTQADLALPVPAIRDGRAEVVVVPGSLDLADYVASLGARAEAVRSRMVTPEEDNMLKISSDGRAAALDVRLVGLDHPYGPTKLTVAAERIHNIWDHNRDRRYRDASGNEHARPGALQLVFAELGTPGGARWGVYDELRRLLTEYGVPAGQVRFMHEARNAREKEQLFAACRNGTVAVLVGTTEKMGVGTNVQARCVALHHLDCPWRPADVEQREGRILRQGNQHPVVDIVRYVTAGSFDVYMWQTVEIKAGFIHQVLAGRVDSRQLDDVASDQELSYAEVKALATGDDRIVRKAGLEADVARLRRQRSAHFEDQARLRRTVDRNTSRTTALTARAATLEALITDLVDTRGDRFAMTVDHSRYQERGPAGTHILAVVDQAMNTARSGRSVERDVGAVGGVNWMLRCHAGTPGAVELTIPGTGLRINVERADMNKMEPSRLVQRLEHVVAKLPAELDTTRTDIDTATAETEAARHRLDVGFAAQPDLTRLESDLAALNADLAREGAEIYATRRGPVPSR